MDLRISSRQWGLQGLVPSGKALDPVTMYETDLSDEENAETMYQMFVNLPAEVITQGVSMIHADFTHILFKSFAKIKQYLLQDFYRSKNFFSLK